MGRLKLVGKNQIEGARVPWQGRRQLREIGGQRFSPKCEGFFWPKSQIFRPKAGDLQNKIKKGLRRNPKAFSGEIANFNVFSAQKHQLLPPKKYRGGARKKSGGGIAPPLATRLSPGSILLLIIAVRVYCCTRRCQKKLKLKKQ